MVHLVFKKTYGFWGKTNIFSAVLCDKKMADNDIGSSPVSLFSGFSEVISSDTEASLNVSSPSSVHTSDLSDFSLAEDSDHDSLTDDNPDSDISDSGEEEILLDSEDDFDQDDDSQYSELSSQASRASEEDFWSDHLVDVDIADFTERCGPVHMLPLAATALDFFMLFFPQHLFQLMVEQTNLYARQSNADARYWEEVIL